MSFEHGEQLFKAAPHKFPPLWLVRHRLCLVFPPLWLVRHHCLCLMFPAAVARETPPLPFVSAAFAVKTVPFASVVPQEGADHNNISMFPQVNPNTRLLASGWDP